MHAALDSTDSLATAQAVMELLARSRLPLHNEKAAQETLQELLDKAKIPFKREARLSAKDIPDFLCGGLAIEVKLAGGKMAIYRQLARYAKHEKVDRLLLVTNVAMGLPRTIEGKPAHQARLGEAWL